MAARCKRASVPRPTGFWRDLLESRATEPDTSDYSSLRLFKTSSGVLGTPEEERGEGGSGLEGEERSNVQTSTNAHTRTKIELLYHETRRVSSRSPLSAPCTPSHLALSPENSEGEHERPSGPTKPDKGKPGLPHNCCPAPRIRRCKVLSQFRPPSCCWQLTTIVVLLLFIANDIAPVTGIVDIIIHN